MDSLIKLTVKTPNQHIEDIQIDCDLTWSVKKLKDYLQDVYPSKPASHSQKLIYLGKLLQDHYILEEVFKECVSQTLHIVCSENDNFETIGLESLVNNFSSNDGLRHRIRNSIPPVAENQPVVDSQFQQQTHQYLWMPNLSSERQQQQQSNLSEMQIQYQAQMQYYMHQMYLWQQSISSNHWSYPTIAQGYGFQLPFTPIPTIPSLHSELSSNTSQPTTPLVTEEQLPSESHIPHPPQEPEQVREQNNPANPQVEAGPGGAIMAVRDDDNDRNRDWLDWLYFSLRGLMLISIVYFYSSTTRFFLVAVLGFIIYIYQAGWFTRRNPAETPVNSERIAEENSETVPNVHRPNVLQLTITLFKCFFSSLIPAGPPALQHQ
ncbi:homocysteine-responsive endoplasmic reticulum-resident ubiquitin-like domain member 2 protein isoform X1 [Hydra vulgaris]|uniref:homocysteine-responsive endoplasmic reticulum-resident ubiquitin-like domain member 2 protein isoform X1 n=1 Tax=Hydra vulgaris TaxID=6087 RepID=UPI001F5E80A8|nr:homocysteine-responsive endoplasmic reticulum-resident ubiquitin-like domain member 2 protein [Hydra vulgaris]